MDIRTDKSSDIDFEPKVQQRRITKVSRYDSIISSARRSDEDRLTLSEEAIEFKELKGLLEEIPEIRQEKVIELREEIKQGKYNIDSEKVAEEILMEEISLGFL